MVFLLALYPSFKFVQIFNFQFVEICSVCEKKSYSNRMKKTMKKIKNNNSSPKKTKMSRHKRNNKTLNFGKQ